MAIETQTSAEIHERLSKPDRAIELHREATMAGMPLGRYLEMIDPSEPRATLDAFGRQLKAAGIVTRSDPRAGYWASEADVFFKTPAGRSLYPEFFARQWRNVVYATPQQRSVFLSSDATFESMERTVTENGPFWYNQIVPAIPLSEIVSTTTSISGEDYRSLFMEYDENALRLFRIGETAEIPMATLTTSEKAIRLRKYGRGLRASYEALRRMRVDKLSWWIQWQAVQSETDKISAALDVLINGDGNANTAATVIDLTTLDATATPPALTMLAWLNFRLQFAPPFTLTTVLMTSANALKLITLNLGSANVPLAGLNIAGFGNTLTPINSTGDGIRYGWTAEAPASSIVGFDNRAALEHVTEIGGEIRETERFITNQTEVMVMTETSAFAKLDPAATKVLNLAA